ncbi:hypothetical protein Tco_0745180 [Tanacetum coccineum]
MSWFSRCSWCGGPFNGGNCRQCTNVSFEDEFVRNPDPISNDETPDFSYPPSYPQTSSFDQFHCFGCGDSLEDGVRCQQCTYKWCGYNLRGGFCLFCASRDGNSSIDAPNPNSFNDPPNVFTHPPQPQYESYSCELCGNDTHYGYDCPPRYPINQLPPQEMSIQDMELQKQQYLEEMQSISNQIQIKDYRNERIDIHYRRECEIKIDELKAKFNKMSIEINKITKEKELRQREQVANLSTYTPKPTRCFNFIYDDDDDDEERIMLLNEIISKLTPPIAITPVLPTMKPEDSLIMGDENLSTIPERESNEFIKSSVEDLVPIPSEKEDTSDNDSECDLPFCNDPSPLDILGENFVTFSNPLFDANDDFTSSDDKSFPEEDVQEENLKIYSNPLFEFNDNYISSDVNPIFNEVLEDIENKYFYVSNLDEPALLVTPLSDANKDECFDPGGEIDEIDAFLDMDISTDIENDYHDLEGDIIYLEILLIDDTIPNLPPKDFPDYEDSCARGFVHRSLKLLSFACLYIGIQ